LLVRSDMYLSEKSVCLFEFSVIVGSTKNILCLEVLDLAVYVQFATLLNCCSAEFLH